MSAHAHPHPHVHAENPWAGQGAVLLDIGDEVGALVVEMPPSMVGHEVEVRRVGGPSLDHLPHVAVVDRPAGNTTVPSLVFGYLKELASLAPGPDGRLEVADILAVMSRYGTEPYRPA